MSSDKKPVPDELWNYPHRFVSLLGKVVGWHNGKPVTLLHREVARAYANKRWGRPDVFPMESGITVWNLPDSPPSADGHRYPDPDRRNTNEYYLAAFCWPLSAASSGVRLERWQAASRDIQRLLGVQGDYK